MDLQHAEPLRTTVFNAYNKPAGKRFFFFPPTVCSIPKARIVPGHRQPNESGFTHFRSEMNIAHCFILLNMINFTFLFRA